jgi:hypothetical protein
MLDFAQVAAQIRTFTTEHAGTLPLYRAALAEAGRRLRESAPKWEGVQARIEESKTSWLLAEWREPPDGRFVALPRPTPCVVYAADGSQLISDRHDFALCYLLNIGLIALRYGPDASASLSSHPTLHCAEDDPEEIPQGEQAAIAPRRLAMRRLLAECAALTDRIETAPDNAPALALLDGSLILWPLESETESFRDESLTAFQEHLDTACEKRVPLAGYISRPASRDVVNALRVAVCPHERANCDHHCENRNKPRPLFEPPPCQGTERVTDADLFASVLRPGERSAVFGSRSKILGQYRPEHDIQFFYLHTGDEVARVEIPHWVAADPELLARTHTLCLDQIEKGDGYPVALAEAHEQAIIRAPERDAFFHLMECQFVATGQPVAISRKAVSKRTRRI